MSRWVHRLDVDENGRGTCAKCGPIQGIRKGPGRWRCPVANSERNRRYEPTRLDGAKHHRLKFIPAGPLVCGICGRGLTVETAHVDHDHTICGHSSNYRRYCEKCFRGVLCVTCNTGLGKFGDDPDLLRRAAAYIERWRAS